MASSLVRQLGLEPTIAVFEPSTSRREAPSWCQFCLLLELGFSMIQDFHSFCNIIHIYKQLKLFEHYQQRLSAHIGVEAAKIHVNRGLVLITLGGNDFVNNYYLVPIQQDLASFLSQDYVNYIISEYRLILKRLYDLGARRVLVTGIGTNGVCACRVSHEKQKMVIVTWNLRELLPYITHNLLK
ncbi:hypothetical protein SESBI_22834 [Sesbania bispinosa]|nr:hypothetical protein SESBI_22834 [Sesbania bispinosa]